MPTFLGSMPSTPLLLQMCSIGLAQTEEARVGLQLRCGANADSHISRALFVFPIQDNLAQGVYHEPALPRAAEGEQPN